MTKVRLSLAFVAISIVLTPASALAQEFPFQASITAAFAGAPNTAKVGFCGGPTGPSAYAYVVEAHGVGTSTLGFLSLTLQKSLDATGPMHGCVTLTAVNGDTLSATYDGTEGEPHALGFQFGTGTLTITGGTGRFKGARGTVKFTGAFSNIETASYLFDGTVSFGHD
ncbi:exported hypothetical protein [Candidatus Sulfopaludibacter sp. SbA3]|nr:exported hypothetical protein [Candidatus Sulfopaludibacter sp. SbA3]